MKRLLSKVRGSEEKEMPFLEHLEELRRALFATFGAIMICALVAYIFSGQVVDYVVVRHVTEAQAIKPMEAFFVRIKVSLLLGLLASLPFVMFQVWNFIVPGLLEQERKLVLPMVVFSTLLFLVGTAFSYLVLTPTMVQMLLAFATEHVRPVMSVDYLFDFIIKLAVACGILFQLPLVVALLTVVRIVTPSFLVSKWRHAIVGILIVAAVATPGDGPSQIILAAPIVVLYFISILISMAIVRGRDEETDSNEEGAAAEGAGGAADDDAYPDPEPDPEPGPAGSGETRGLPPGQGGAGREGGASGERGDSGGYEEPGGSSERGDSGEPGEPDEPDVWPREAPEGTVAVTETKLRASGSSRAADADAGADSTPATTTSPIPGGNEWEREADWSSLADEWRDEDGGVEPPSSPRRFIEQGEDPRGRSAGTSEPPLDQGDAPAERPTKSLDGSRGKVGDDVDLKSGTEPAADADDSISGKPENEGGPK